MYVGFRGGSSRFSLSALHGARRFLLLRLSFIHGGGGDASLAQLLVLPRI